MVGSQQYLVDSWHVFSRFLACIQQIPGMYLVDSWHVFSRFLACIQQIPGHQLLLTYITLCLKQYLLPVSHAVQTCCRYFNSFLGTSTLTFLIEFSARFIFTGNEIATTKCTRVTLMCHTHPVSYKLNSNEICKVQHIFLIY